MPMDSVSEENVEKLVNEHEAKLDELERIKSTTIEQMWLSELDILENEYREYQKDRAQAHLGETKALKKPKTITKVAGGAKKVIKKALAGGGPVTHLELDEEDMIIMPKKKTTN